MQQSNGAKTYKTAQKAESEEREDHERIAAMQKAKSESEAALVAEYGDRDTLRMNGVALVLCSVNPEFEVIARRVIAGEGNEEDKKNLVWILVKATRTFSLDVFERWLKVAQI
jgi:hypothetical protein